MTDPACCGKNFAAGIAMELSRDGVEIH